MIQLGSQMDFSNQTFGLILCGAPGVGKTTLAMSDGCDGGDTLVMDLENGIGRTSALHRLNAKILTANNYDEVKANLDLPEARAVKNVVFDTAGSLIDFLKEWAIKNNGSLRQRDGGFNWRNGAAVVYGELQNLLRKIRVEMGKNLIYIFHTDETQDQDGNPQQRLRCEGKLKNTVWQGIDFGGFMEVNRGRRYITFTADNAYPSKASHGIDGRIEIPFLGENVQNDFVKNLFDAARANMRKENEIIQGKKDAYEKIISDVTELVSGVTDADSANACYKAIKAMSHALTSLSESNKILYNKAVSLKLKYSKADDAYMAGDAQ